MSGRLDGALPELRTERLILSLPPPAAAQAVAAYYSRNRAHLAPWEPVRPEAFFTADFWREQLAANRAELHADRSARFFLQLADGDGAIVGGCNLTGIARGPMQAAYLGYNLGAEHEGRGLMSEALEALLPWAFGALDLHRIMANHLPENTRSARLLARLGFETEGRARAYLKIGGAWRDHVLTALIRPEPGAADA